MVSKQFISKFKSASASDNCQMVSDLIRVRNRIRTSIRWPQMTSGNGENGRPDDKDEI
jgi:hypothetical protein